MKVIKVLVAILVVIAVALVGGILWVNHYLQSPDFKQRVLTAARDALGTDVKINDLQVSVFSGISLKGVAIANPEGYPGQLLTADAFVLRYRLLPLLRRRVEVEELSLQKPNIVLARAEKGGWNYEKLTEKPGQPAPAGSSDKPAPKEPPGSSKATASPAGLNITLSKLAMTGGNIVMLDEKQKELLKIQGVNLSSAIDLTGGKLSGSGQAGIESIAAANSLFIRKIASPVQISAGAIRLTPLSGTVAGGTMTGDIAANLVGDLKYTVTMQIKDSDVDTLLQEAHTKRVVEGKLQATVALEGTGGLPTISGTGRVEVVGGKLANIPVLNVVAFLLQVPVLKDLKFDECRLEFSLSNNVMQTPVIRLISPEVQITGTGSVNLADNSLNHNLTLAFAKSALANVPREIRAIFTERPDGFLAVDFRVWGPYDAPKQDLEKRLVKGAIQQLVPKDLQNLFK